MPSIPPPFVSRASNALSLRNRLEDFGRFSKEALAVATLMVGPLLYSQPAHANPTGASVQAGNVKIQSIGPNTLQIDQFTQKAIIDWRSFSSNPQEIIRFLQPNSTSVILNRVTGQDPSTLLGQLLANGQVFLLNPNGVVFGPGSVTNVAGLFVSTLKMSNEDFLKGNYALSQDPNFHLSSVVNQGSITITDGGFAVLAAPLVSNQGLIVANLGKVTLAAGEQMVLNFDGRNLINFRVDGLNGKPGTVLIGQDQLTPLLASVVKNSAINEAGAVKTNSDGTISLVGASGTLVQEGIIRVNAEQGKAGTVVLDSGQATVVGPNARVEARGLSSAADGGDIILNSRGMTVTTQGSSLIADGARGGFIETSGHRAWLRGSINAGRGGSWSLDPDDLNIINGNGGSLDGALPSPTGGASETISEIALESMPAGTNISLQANNFIRVQPITDNAITLTPNTTLNLATNGSLSFDDNGNQIVTSGVGGINISTGTSSDLGVLNATGSAGSVGNINIISSNVDIRDIYSNGTTNIVATSGDIVQWNGRVWGQNATLTASMGTLTQPEGNTFYTGLNGSLAICTARDVNLDNIGNVTVGNVLNNNGIKVTTGDFCWNNQGNITVASPVSVPSGSISIVATGQLTLDALISAPGPQATMILDVASVVDSGTTATKLQSDVIGILSQGAIGSPTNTIEVETSQLLLVQPNGGGAGVFDRTGNLQLINSNVDNNCYGTLLAPFTVGNEVYIGTTGSLIVDPNLMRPTPSSTAPTPTRLNLAAGNELILNSVQAETNTTNATIAPAELVFEAGRNGAGNFINNTGNTTPIIARSVGLANRGLTSDINFNITTDNLAILSGGTVNTVVSGSGPALNITLLQGQGTGTNLVGVSGLRVDLNTPTNVNLNASSGATTNFTLNATGGILLNGTVSSINTSLNAAGGNISNAGPTVDLGGFNAALNASGNIDADSSVINIGGNSPGSINLTGVRNIANVTGGVTSFNGLNATNNICVTGPSVNVIAPVTAQNVSLASAGNLLVASSVNASRQAELAAGTAGTGSLDDSGGGLFVNSPNLLLNATSAIGSAVNPLDASASNLSAASSAGSLVLNVSAPSGTVTVGNLTSFKSPASLNGLAAGQNVDFNTPGNLHQQSAITAGQNASINASGQVDLNSTVSASQTASIEAGGNISGNFVGNEVRATSAVLRSGANINLDLNVTNLSAQASLVNLTGSFNVANGTAFKSGLATNGINATSDVCLESPAAINVLAPIRAGQDIAIRAVGPIALNSTSNATRNLSLETQGAITANSLGASPNLQGSNVVLLASDIATAQAASISSPTVAARATAGNVNLDLFGTSTNVSQLTTAKGGQLVSGINASGSVNLEATNGSLTVSNGVFAQGNQSIQTAANLNLQSDLVAGNLISLESGGQVLSAPGVSANGASLVGVAVGNIDLALNVSNFAARAETVNVSGSFNVANLTTLGNNVVGNGINTTNNVCIQAVGPLNVNAPVVAANVIAINGTGDLTVDASMVSNRQISLETTGAIRTNVASLTHFAANDVVLLASDIGAGNPLTVQATRAAARASTGNLNLEFSGANTTIANLTTLKGGQSLNGLSAGQSISADAINGSLQLNSPVTAVQSAGLAVNGSLGLAARVAAGNMVSLDIAGNVLNQLAGADVNTTNFVAVLGGDLDVDVAATNFAARAQNVNVTGSFNVANLTTLVNGVTSNGINSSNNVCIQSPGPLNINAPVLAGNVIAVDSGGDVNVDASMSANRQVSVQASGNIRSNQTITHFAANQVILLASDVGSGQTLTVQAPQLAAQASNGNLSLDVVGSNASVSNLTTAKDNRSVNGLLANQTLAIEAVNGSLQLDAPITAGQTAGLAVNGTLSLNAPITANNTVSLDVTGNIRNQLAGADINTGNLVFSSGGNASLDLNVTNLAAQGNGLNLTGSLNVFNGTTLFGARNLTGLNSTTDTRVDAVGTLNLLSRVTAGNTVGLRSTADIAVNAGVSSGQMISLETASNITGQSPGVQFTSPSLVLLAQDLGSAAPLTANVQRFAARASAGNVNVDFSGTNTQITSLTTLIGQVPVNGVSAANGVCLETLNGSLGVNAPITAGADLALRTAGNLALNATLNAPIISLESGGDILNQNPGLDLNGQSAVATAVGDINLDLNVTNFAAQGRNVTATGLANTANLTTRKGNRGVNGVNATNVANLFGPTAVNVNAPIAAGQNASLQAVGNIRSAALFSAGFNGSVDSTSGSVVDANGNSTNFAAPNLTLRAADSLGTMADGLELRSSNLAAQAVNGSFFLQNTSPSLNVTTLTTLTPLNSNATLIGVRAAQIGCLEQSGTLNITSASSANELVLQSGGNLMLSQNVTAASRMSLESTNASINDIQDGAVHVVAPSLAISAGANIAAFHSPLLIETDNLAARALGGDIGLVDQSPGLNITAVQLGCSGVNVSGLTASNNLRMGLTQGDIVLRQPQAISSGTGFNVTVVNGSLLQNSPGNGLVSGANGVVNACNGTVGTLNAPVAVNMVGNLVINSNSGTVAGIAPENLTINLCAPTGNQTAPPQPYTPDPLAQNNVFLGEPSDYYPITMPGMVDERPRYPYTVLLVAFCESGSDQYQLQSYFKNRTMESSALNLTNTITWGQPLPFRGDSPTFFVDISDNGLSYSQSTLTSNSTTQWPNNLQSSSWEQFAEAFRLSLAPDNVPETMIDEILAQLKEFRGQYMLARVQRFPGVKPEFVLLVVLPHKS